MLLKRETSLCDEEMDSFAVGSKRTSSETRESIHNPEQTFSDIEILNSLLCQIMKQPFPEYHNNQYQDPNVKHKTPESRPHCSSHRTRDLPYEGFKDLLLLNNDYFLTICDDDVKLYSDNGDMIDKLKLTCTPLSLSRFGERCVVIICYSRRLCMLTIENNVKLHLQLEVETAIQYCSVSQLRYNELICIGLESAVLHQLIYKYGTVTLVSVLPLVMFGVTVRHQLGYRHVHVTSSGQIIITDRMNDYILSLSMKGNWKIRFFYRPQAIVSDENHIYIAQGGGLNFVHRFNLNGSNRFCILRKEHGLVNPWGLSLNRNRKLMVTNNAEGQPGVRLFTGLD